MIPYGSRKDFERWLVNALSRYIGYTTAAYDIDRIFSVLEYFRGRPSGYGNEIVLYLKEQRGETSLKSEKPVTDEYVAEALNFSVAMQLIELVSDRHVRVKRYAPTQKGRSVMGAQLIEDDGFFQFFRTRVVLTADADAILPVLTLSRKTIPARSEFSEYRGFHESLRKRRLAWLRQAFPEARLFDRIAEQLPWLKKKASFIGEFEIERLSMNTARHHVSPRKQWLAQLGLVDELGGNVTVLGTNVLNSLVNDDQYFWVGPPEGVQDGLRIAKERQMGGPHEDEILLSQTHERPTSRAIDEVVEATAGVMMRGYEGAKLAYAPQAPLELPIEYIAYRSYVDKSQYNWHEVLELLFKRYRPSLERLSARRGPVGFYKAKERKWVDA